LHPDYRYCPRCATPFETRELGGLARHVCPACDFTHWNNPTPVVAALLQVGEHILLARNAAWPPRMFALITGFLERDESPEEGVAREVKEETNLDARSVELIGVYPFTRKNELIIAYHVQAEGQIALSPELADFKLVEPARLRPWRAGTGLAMADWMQRRGLEVEFVDLPGRSG
jgi:NADH pyrophosphatase NudC (nudix superfamily)